MSQVVDLGVNGGNGSTFNVVSTPSYTIHENGISTKITLFNYLDDQSGAHDLNGAMTPSEWPG